MIEYLLGDDIMKKGAIGSIIGVVVFFLVANLVFQIDSSFFSAVPTVFFVIFIGGIFKFIKKANNTQNGGKQDYNDKDGDLHENSYHKSTNRNKYEDDILTTRPRNNSNYQNEYSEQKTSFSKRCKDCNALISSDDSYCPECGGSQKTTIICEYCGHENPSTSALCDKCNGYI